MTAEGPANKLAHCASDFAAGSRTPVHTQEKLNSTILLFDLGQSLGAASLIFFLSLIKRGFYVLEICFKTKLPTLPSVYNHDLLF